MFYVLGDSKIKIYYSDELKNRLKKRFPSEVI